MVFAGIVGAMLAVDPGADEEQCHVRIARFVWGRERPEDAGCRRRGLRTYRLAMTGHIRPAQLQKLGNVPGDVSRCIFFVAPPAA